MLDANPCRLTTPGQVTVQSDGVVVVTGAEAENGTCRDTAALAMLWAIGRLQAELQATLERPGGGKVTIE